MKQQLLKLIVVLPFIVLGLASNAQLTTKTFRKAIPAEFIEASSRKIPDIFIKAPAELKKFLTTGDDPNANVLRFRFAVAKKESVNVLEKATKTVKDGFITYLTTVTAEDALNISVSFNKFYLPPNAVLKIYSKNELTDGITDVVNSTGKTWNTRVYKGNRITFFLKVPVAEKGKALLEIGKVCFGFRKIEGNIPGSFSENNTLAPQPPSGQSADCNVNVYCALGNNWQAESRSVALIYDGDGFMFSGSMVMNTCGTNKPYLLTAYHTFDPQQNQGAVPVPANCKYVFKYWRLNCSNTVEQYNETYEIDGRNGNKDAEIVAKHVPSDFALILLPTTPSPTSGVTYSGWNRSGTVPSQVTALHHPLGDVMKISQSNSNIFSTSWTPPYQNTHWQAKFDDDKGIIQSGSSGGPIYNQDRKLIGQLHGIYSVSPHGCINSPQIPNTTHCACVSQSAEQIAAKTSVSGKFSASWTGGGNKFTSLSFSLNPSNLPDIETSTTDVSLLTAPLGDLLISGDNAFCSTSNLYTIPGLPNGATVHWDVTPSGAATANTPNSQQTTLTAGTGGNITLSATVTYGSCSNVIIIKNNIQVSAGGAPSCSTRVAYQMVNGNPVQVSNCIRLTQIRSVYLKGTISKPGLTEYYTNVYVVDPTAVNCITTPCIRWEYVSSAGYSTYITNGSNVEVIIPVSPANGWMRLRCITENACGSYSLDYWFTPQPSTLNCPVFNPCMIFERKEEITNTPAEKITLSPNPTNGQFKVSLGTDVKEATIREVRIKNKMGIQVYQQIFKNAAKEQNINVLNLPVDIYIVEVFDGKIWMTEKLSVQR